MRALIPIPFLLTIFIFTAPSYAAQAVQPPSGWQQDGPEAHAEQFLDLMVQGKLEDAFKALLGNRNTQSLDKLKFEIYSVYKKSGKPLGYEQVLKHKAGKSIVKLRYVLLFRDLPKTFDLYYYNPTGQEWRLRTFSFIKDVKKIFAQ